VRAFVGTGATLDEETVRTFGMMAGEEAARGREAIEREKILTRATDAERRAQLAEERADMSRDPVIAQVEKMLKNKELTPEQARKMIEDRIQFLNTKSENSIDRLTNVLTGGGLPAPGARSTTQPGGTGRPPATTIWR
jgi:hypothetical protein